ncbi:MAG: hypothetical protein IJ545_02460 [Alphaproteobacteria bacterium]|nr:hypothetical protein [Alphaproteobacteria bacterium]
MDLSLLFQALLSLAFVIGLVLVVFWLIKVCEAKGLSNPLLKKVNGHHRLSVIESKRLDARNTLVLARCDDEEFLLLLGGAQNTLLQSKKVLKNG